MTLEIGDSFAGPLHAREVEPEATLFSTPPGGVSDEVWKGTSAQLRRASEGLPIVEAHRYTTADFYEE